MLHLSYLISSVALSCPTLCDPMDCSTPGLHVHHQLLKLMSTEVGDTINHLILCHPLLPPSIFPSIRVFSNESPLHIRWPKYWSFSFIISPFNQQSGLISLGCNGCISLQSKGLSRVCCTLLQTYSYHSTATFCPITNSSPFPPPLHPGSHHSALCLYVFNFFKIIHMISCTFF